MSQWMMQLGNRSKGPVEGYVSQPNFPTKHSAGNVYGRRSRMVNSDGAPSPYNPDAAQLAAVRSIEHHSTDHMIPGKNCMSIFKKNLFSFFLSLLDGRIHSSTSSILHKQRIRRLPQILPASQPAVPKQTLPSIWPSKVSLINFLSLSPACKLAVCYSDCWVYPHRLRHGRAGGSWRHVKEVLQAGGRRIVFVDGRYVRLEIGIVSKRVYNLH